MTIRHILPLAALAAASAFAQTGVNKANMDPSARPGTDFFEYANGGWNAAHPLTAEYSRYGAMDDIAENNRRQLRELIEGFAHQTNTPGSLGQKIGDLYNLAMDSTRRNQEGWQPIRADIESIAAAPTKADLFKAVARMGRYGVPSMVNIWIDADLKNSRQNLVYISQGGISLGERDYYVDSDSTTLNIRKAYTAYIQRLFELTGTPAAEAAQKAATVLRMETALAQPAYSATQQRDPEANYHKMTYAQLLADYAGTDWNTLFRTLGFPDFAEVSVCQPEPIKAAGQLWQDSPLNDLKTYTTFKLIDAAAGTLSDEFRQTAFDFYGRTLSGRQQESPAWKRAVSSVEGVLGEAVGRMYVEKYFPASSKERMVRLVANLQKALGQRIDAQDWMSEATKQKAHEKLNTFIVKVGYPDQWRDYSALTIDTASYWANLCRASEFELAYIIGKKVNKPVDRSEWAMTPQTVNAYYNPTTNEICFPAGILQPPFFDAAADDAMNYGAIGVVIGHEMTHGFDDSGRQFDKDGNLRDWWTAEDGERFKAKAKVMADFFNGIEVLPGLKANGELTLGENLADHGGLKVAYQAFKNVTAGKADAVNDGFTPDQRFFIAYANVWAGNIRDEQIRVYTKSDPHSLGRWRVNGALPHIDAWYTAFGITEKDPLFVPKAQRADIW
ncbi:MAG TPA: M13 family metallopeptidase [Candidatus Caccomonas pullistercoris]|nr:M13 family metallopeptidase [Candidatus Caccomonas pullistercoris]